MIPIPGLDKITDELTKFLEYLRVKLDNAERQRARSIELLEAIEAHLNKGTGDGLS